MRELPTQVVDVPLSGGLQQHVDKRLVQAGAFLKLENWEHEKGGTLTNRKGYGYLPETDGAARNVATRGAELYALCAPAETGEPPSLATYHETVGEWRRQCDAWRVGYARRAVGREDRGALLGQRVVVGQHVVFVWWGPFGSGGGRLTFRVEDLAGTLVGELSPLSPLVDKGEFRVAAAGLQLAVLSHTGSSTNWNLSRFSPASMAFVDVGSVGGLNYDRGGVDMKAVPGSPDVVAVAHSLASEAVGAIKLRLSTVSLTTGLVVQTSAGTAVGGELVAASISFAGSSCGVAYRHGNSVGSLEQVHLAKFAGFTAGGSFTAAPAFDVLVFDGLVASFLIHSSHSFGVGLCHDVADPDGFVVATTDDAAVLAKRLDDGGSVVGATGFRVSSAMLLSEPFAFDGAVCAVLGAYVNDAGGDVPSGGTKFATAALVSLYPGIDHHAVGLPDARTRFVAASAAVEALSGRLVDALASGNNGTSSHGLMAPSFNANGSVSFAPSVLFGAPTSSRDYAVGVDEVTFSPEGTPTFAGAAGSSVSSGGLTAQYDGKTWAECGFLHRPNVYTPVGLSNVSGSLALAAGAYLYAIVYEWVDDAGNLHQSEPAFLPVSVSPPASFSTVVTLSVRCIALTQKPGVTIAVYRTKVDSAGPFYRLTPRSVLTSSLQNFPEVKSRSFVDGSVDAVVTSLGFGLLYTDGGLRPNVLPPPTRHVVRHQNRLWAISADDPNEVLFTKLLVRGEPAQFARGLSVRVDGLPSPAVALASNGDRLVIFTADGIFYLVGQGPDDTGQNGTFSEAYQVPTTCGCVDPRSVVSTHLGVFFLGPAGLMLLDLGMQVVPAGAPVEDEVRGSFCRRAVIDEASRRAYWLFAATSSGPPVATRYVVYDYDNDAWYAWRINPSGLQRDQCVWKGEHVVCDGRPAVRGRGAAPAADATGAYVAASLRLPWLNFAGVSGFQRLQWLRIKGRRNQPCTLRVRLYVDHNDTTPVQDRTFDLSSASTVAGLPNFALALDVKRQLAAQHLVEISHESAAGADNAGARAGVELVAPAFVVGVLNGPSRVGAQNRKLRCRSRYSPPSPPPSPSPAPSAACSRTRRRRPKAPSRSTPGATSTAAARATRAGAARSSNAPASTCTAATASTPGATRAPWSRRSRRAGSSWGSSMRSAARSRARALRSPSGR